ncbi:2-amino-4,5-dihydroxy-6-one-heptanoic acid-7-phosphate synthase [Actinoplanes sp. LDG1-06]|uniref:2-amino-4,5-dihydroxy-6-one-heptanoic acid-7-phosphate synthase n=1 Tax=Paractinoplanes ovalisporus TaxID=2810368 RepID=A0ABS2A846_9ACTN|nr:2-amino-3,7-dideoxy-D-threo-hept-6-ulosonate synthase [Actinoplanes ovalisporus]MBM2616006.1 2-amino-4,5-dihydroxy-6-one-heptanoic acid-7-phosphate synthase [Actinoplanes ovalisporus]
MHAHGSFARRLRLRRLHRHPSGLLVVPLDHAMSGGPLAHRGTLDGLLARLADGGADAVVLHKGAVRRVRPDRFREMSLILHLNASTGLASDPDAKYPVATVAEALRLGAEAVSVHVNVGSRTEDRQIAHLAGTAEQCDRWGVPLLAMMYVRGPGITDGRDPELVAHALAVGAELGADLVKTALPDDPAAIARITAGCPVPVLAAGGHASFEVLETALRAGAAGLAVGRTVFTADDPGAVTRRLSALAHGDRTPAGVR